MAGETFSRTGWEGAAIHYEKIAGNPTRALQIVERALSLLEGLATNKGDRVALTGRRDRLLQKGIPFHAAAVSGA